MTLSLVSGLVLTIAVSIVWIRRKAKRSTSSEISLKRLDSSAGGQRASPTEPSINVNRPKSRPFIREVKEEIDATVGTNPTPEVLPENSAVPSPELTRALPHSFFDSSHQPVPLSFRVGDSGESILAAEWENPDAWGAWCVGNVANLVIPESYGWKNAVALKFEGHVFAPDVAPFYKSRKIQVTLNDIVTVERSVTHKTERDVGYSYFVIPFDDAVMESESDLRIQIQFLLSASPKECGLGADDRPLGFQLMAIHPIAKT
ncbi:MAG: hypothetical protein FIA97_08655 [Methylococcaceae bacterium]|nr:hypothetical protein [Methylococcaceae bacterium]